MAGSSLPGTTPLTIFGTSALSAVPTTSTTLTSRSRNSRQLPHRAPQSRPAQPLAPQPPLGVPLLVLLPLGAWAVPGPCSASVAVPLLPVLASQEAWLPPAPCPPVAPVPPLAPLPLPLSPLGTKHRPSWCPMT